MNSFSVEKVVNGFTIKFDQKIEVAGDPAWVDYQTKTFVFDTPAKLKKGLKLMVEQLTQESDNV